MLNGTYLGKTLFVTLHEKPVLRVRLDSDRKMYKELQSRKMRLNQSKTHRDTGTWKLKNSQKHF